MSTTRDPVTGRGEYGSQSLGAAGAAPGGGGRRAPAAGRAGRAEAAVAAGPTVRDSRRLPSSTEVAHNG